MRRDQRDVHGVSPLRFVIRDPLPQPRPGGRCKGGACARIAVGPAQRPTRPTLCVGGPACGSSLSPVLDFLFWRSPIESLLLPVVWLLVWLTEESGGARAVSIQTLLLVSSLMVTSAYVYLYFSRRPAVRHSLMIANRVVDKPFDMLLGASMALHRRVDDSRGLRLALFSFLKSVPAILVGYFSVDAFRHEPVFLSAIVGMAMALTVMVSIRYYFKRRRLRLDVDNPSPHEGPLSLQQYPVSRSPHKLAEFLFLVGIVVGISLNLIVT